MGLLSACAYWDNSRELCTIDNELCLIARVKDQDHTSKRMMSLELVCHARDRLRSEFEVLADIRSKQSCGLNNGE